MKSIDYNGEFVKDENGLTAMQAAFVNTWIATGENAKETAKALGWGDDYRRCHAYKAKGQIKLAILKRKGELAEFLQKQAHIAGITPEMKARALWEIAEKGKATMIDKDGNQIMVNPGAAVSAIRELNLMSGSHAPVKTETNVVVSKRDEKELIDSIENLKSEYESLLTKMTVRTDNFDIEDAEYFDVSEDKAMVPTTPSLGV